MALSRVPDKTKKIKHQQQPIMTKKNRKQTVYLLAFSLLLLASCDKKADSDLPLPDINTTDSISNITYSTATGGGEITEDYGETVTARGICWSTNVNPTIQYPDSMTIDGSGAGLFKSNIKNLMPCTKYYVRAYATNSRGTAYSNTINFTTQGNKFTDSRDGHVYRTVTIGKQTWMAENLAYQPIPLSSEIKGSEYAGYNNFPFYYQKPSYSSFVHDYAHSGILYNWYAAISAAPIGWHLPTDSEWNELADSLGSSSYSDKLLKSGTTSNSSGFSALLGTGYRNMDGIEMSTYDSSVGYQTATAWWSSTNAPENKIYTYWLKESRTTFEKIEVMKYYGLSIRCVKDN